MVYIYLLIRNGVVFYVGKTKVTQFKARSRKHEVSFGEDIEIETIDEVLEVDWVFWERHYISLIKSWGFILLNKNPGGNGPTSLSEESRQKIRDSKIGHPMYNNPEWKINIGKGNKGKKRTEEQIEKQKVPKPEGFGEKISKANKGKTLGRKITWSDKISKALMGKPKSDKFKMMLSERMMGNQNLKGFIYSNESKDNISKNKSKYPILCIETNEIFRNIRFASEEMDISPTMIRDVCLGKRENAKGYTFKFIDKEE